VFADRWRGLGITASGVLVLSVDAPLVKLIDADAWTVVAWRGLLMVVGFAALSAMTAPRALGRGFRALSRYDLLAAACFGVSNLCFVTAAKLIPVANLLLVIATTPLVTALVGRGVLGERLRPQTAMAIAGALAGIGVLVAGQFELRAGVLGHAVALGCTASTSGFFVLMRRGRSSGSGPALVLGALLVGVASLPRAWPPTVGASSVPHAMLLGLVVIPVAYTLIAQGPRYLPAAEVSFLMLLETVIGPVWAWMMLGETPSARALAGGSLVIVSVVGYVLSLRRTGQPAATGS
jgi:drug/metabolite transporter (DMT)-like permease